MIWFRVSIYDQTFFKLPTIFFFSKQSMFIPTRKSLFLFSSICIYVLNPIITLAQPDFVFFVCNNADNYTLNSKYKTNLDTTLSVLPTTNSGLGFYNLSIGQDNDKVNSIALCRGDVNPNACNTCLNEAIVNLRKLS